MDFINKLEDIQFEISQIYTEYTIKNNINDIKIKSILFKLNILINISPNDLIKNMLEKIFEELNKKI